MKKIFIFADFPSDENPAHHQFVEHRVDVLKEVYDVTVITISYKESSENRIVYMKKNGYSIITLNIKKVVIPKVRVAIYEYQIKKHLEKIIKVKTPDLIHVHFSSYYSWIVCKLSKKNKIPFVITEHASFFERDMSNYFLSNKIKNSIESANCVISVSESLKKTINKHVKKEIIVINNVVDVKRFNLKNKRENISNQVKIITVGRLDKKDSKGYLLLLKVMKKLQLNNYNVECNIIGDGFLYDTLKEKIKEYRIVNTKLLGVVMNDQLPSYYKSSDFFVSSSKKETFGVAIIEAMSSGLPIVSTKSGGPEEFISSSVGLLTEYSIDSLYENIVKMIATYSDYNPKVISGIVNKKYSKLNYLKLKKEVYDELLKL